MTAQINYILGHPSEFSEFRSSIPLQLEVGGFLLCTSGSAQVFVDTKLFEIRERDLLVAFPYSYAQAIQASSDFDGILFGVNLEFIINANIPDKEHYITSISENPCVSLNTTQFAKVLEIHKTFLQETKNTHHPFYNEILDARLRIVLYEIAALFSNATPNPEYKISRDKEIFNHFLIHLYSSESHSRELFYFAQSLSITPSHLSKVVKRVSCRPASQWISDYTIICIKRLLLNKEMQITTIAEELNFPNASFLTQYFKRYTGQTPKQYRIMTTSTL